MKFSTLSTLGTKASHTAAQKGTNIMPQRKIIIHAAAPAVDKNEIARILAYYITGGDAAGYLSKLAEKQHKEAENLKAI